MTTKEDRTPVTQADVECEQAIREIILGEFPEHGFFGEETGRTQADAEFLWLVDPIDGTKGFVRQYPFFSTQIALLHEGKIVLGVSSGTMLDELAWAEAGRGAWLNGRPLAVSRIDDPERATELAAEAYRTDKGILEIIREKKILTDAQIEQLLDPGALTGQDR